MGGHYHRYPTNSHYLRILNNRYLTAKFTAADVDVYSLSQSVSGNFSDFVDRGYTFKLDAPIEKDWEALMSATVVVLSRSSFSSYVPALFNDHILYTNFLALGAVCVPPGLESMRIFKSRTRKI